MEEYQDLIYFLFLKFFSITPEEVDKLNVVQIHRFVVWYKRMMKKMQTDMMASGGWESLI